MSDEIAIKVAGVGKTFKLPHEKNSSIKGAVLNFYKRNRTYETQQVLKDISFEIKKGEFFGIVGRNGSGKSTLLKLLAGIYTPSKGRIQVNGKLTPFIELGVGFNPELTGRENVFLNGALLGFNRSEMNKMYDDIVEFAELEKFMDQKLKNYSSGMQVRLAFSIAIRAESDILVLDEVLAVGDEAFQKKCIDVFEEYKSKKQTIVLVTHDMETVKQFCSQAMLIDQGEIILLGDPNKAANSYTELNNASITQSIDEKNRIVFKSYMGSVELVSDSTAFFNDEATLRISWTKQKRIVKNLGVAVYKNTGEYVFGANTILDKIDIGSSKTLDYSINLSVGNGNYHYKVAFFGESEDDIIEFIDKGPEFRVVTDNVEWEGISFLKHRWGK